MRALSSKTFLTLLLTAPLTAQAEWSTYFGQSGDDWLVAMTTDELGRVYVCGQTDLGVAVSPNCYQPAVAGGLDAYVACLDPRLPSAQQLVWATHFGGSGEDLALDLHVDALGTRVTIVGRTESADMPTLLAFQPQLAGARDAFVATFDTTAAGSAQLVSATYLGGAANDKATAVDVTAGMTTIVGHTMSTDFPTQSPWQAASGGGRDLFVTRLLPGGTVLFSTYLGGSGGEGPSFFNNPFGERSVRLAVDDTGAITVASGTYSADYPLLDSTAKGPRGNYDIVLSQLDVAGSLTYSTVLAGTQDDVVHAVSLDNTGRLVLAGHTYSPNFPFTPNAVQGYQGAADGLLVHLDPVADQVLFATSLGGSNDDFVRCAYRERAGTFVLGGNSWSADFQATAGAPQPSLPATISQGYLVRLVPGTASNVTDVPYMTWFGGTGRQTFVDIEPDGRGGVFGAGPTISTDFPVTGNAFDPTFDGVRDGWIAVHPMLPALMSRYGQAGNACDGTSYLQVDSAPLAGNAGFVVEAHDGPAGAIGLLAFGAPLPTGVAAFGVDVLVAPPAVTLALQADADGFVSTALPIPAGYTWNGQLGMQVFWLNPPSCPGGFLSASSALR